MSINAKWTMTAESKQYCESIAIDETIRNDKQRQIEWERRQLEHDEKLSKPESIEELEIQ